MELTAKDREFLAAVAQDRLPRYETLSQVHRAAGRLVRAGLLNQGRRGCWTHYSLTTAGQAELGQVTKTTSATPLAGPGDYLDDAGAMEQIAAILTSAVSAREALTEIIAVARRNGRTGKDQA